MKMNEYQAGLADLQKHVAIKEENRLAIVTLGLCSESGEIASHIKKHLRGEPLDKEKVKKELGDVLAYVAMMANYFEWSLEDVAEVNLKKLNDRKMKGTLLGSGDDR